MRDRFVPYVAVAAPLICFAIDTASTHWLHYRFGYEMLMVNGLLTFLGLWMLREQKTQ